MSLPPPMPSALPLVSSIESLRDRSESTAFTANVIFVCIAVIALFFISWILIPVGVLLWLGSFILAARIKGNGIKITANQFPALHSSLERCRARLGNPTLEAYILQDSAFNAFAIHLAARNYVVLYSGAVDAILRKGDVDQLEFLMGHECGHVTFGHVSFLRGTVPAIAELLCPPLHAWYRRCQERSADRAGLWACDSREKAIRGLSTLAAGAELGPQVKLAEVRSQWDTIHGEFFVMLSTFFSHYPPLTQRILLVDTAANELRMP